VADDPIERFRGWLDDAVRGGLPEPTAMALATADAGGVPANRMVLLKGVDGDGFTFFTNYDSAKGHDLTANPHAALVFHWQPLGRQVRVVGPVAPVPAAESDAYFATRPRGSQLGAWASPQSQPIDSRATLEQRVAELDAQWAEGEIPRPPHWGGFRVRPETIEFWSHRNDRLHDRERYRRTPDGWAVDRLGP
jgi:pyridoxamine 5'-phosphate oxidase